MGLFAENTWEPNETADKYAKLLDKKSKKNKKSKKLNKNVNFKKKPKPTVQENKKQKKKFALSKEQNVSEVLVKKVVPKIKQSPKKEESKPSTEFAPKNKQRKKNKIKVKETIEVENQSKQKVRKQLVPKQNKNKLLKQKSQNLNEFKNQNTKKRKKGAEKEQKRIIDKKVKHDESSEYFNITPKKSKKKKKLAKTEVSFETELSDSENKTQLKTKNFAFNKLQRMLSAKDTSQSKRKQSVEPTSLRDRMMAHLRSSRFRFLNEQLYESESTESMKFFKGDPDSFAAYHEGYRQQIDQWPLNPLDVIIASIKKLPKDHIVADFGCGEARLADSVPQSVHSFDLVALNDKVKACDMAHTPLLTNNVHVVVFCLSLMGTNLKDYLLEANRVLKNEGILKIAEVESRFENIDDFISILSQYGFTNTWKDLSNNLFYFMDFKKVNDVTRKNKKLPSVELKSCLYKKR